MHVEAGNGKLTLLFIHAIHYNQQLHMKTLETENLRYFSCINAVLYNGIQQGLYTSGVATGGQGGQSTPLDSEKITKNREKREKSRKRGENSEKNWEKEEKSGRFFHFAPNDR